MDKQNKLIVYGMYCSYMKSIQHFDRLQTYYRMMTSTLLLASFASIGYLFSASNKGLPLSLFFTLMLVYTITVVGIIALWHLDLIFYQRLYVSNLIEAFKLEKSHHWLSRVHHNMLHVTSFRGSHEKIIYYYIGCIISITITVGLISLQLFDKTVNSLLCITFSTLIVVLIFSFFLKKKTKSISIMKKELKSDDW